MFINIAMFIITILSILGITYVILVEIRSKTLYYAICDGFFDWVGHILDVPDKEEWNRKYEIMKKTNIEDIIVYDFRIWSFDGLLKQLGEKPLNK